MTPERLKELRGKWNEPVHYTDDEVLELLTAAEESIRLRRLLEETLKPGAYGVGSTLASRIEAALKGEP